MGLDFLKLPDADAVRVPWQTVRAQVVAILCALGVPQADADVTADVLIKADLFGVDTHGSVQVVYYATMIQNGRYTIPQRITVVADAPAAATLSNGGGLGIPGAHRAMTMAIEKARAVGVGMVTVRDGHHIGMVGYYPLMAIAQDMIGMAMTNGTSRVRPALGVAPRLGTNPIAFGAPAARERPFLFDASTSTVAFAKLGLARRLGVDIPVGWAVDAAGAPVTSPSRQRSEQWALNPLGNTREQGAHKGYGLGMMVDILTGVLSGGGYFGDLRPGDNQAWCLAVDIAQLRPLAEFKAHMDAMIAELHATPPEPGVERVLVAGDPEHDHEVDRRANGIPLHRSVLAEMRAKASEVGAAVLI